MDERDRRHDGSAAAEDLDKSADPARREGDVTGYEGSDRVVESVDTGDAPEGRRGSGAMPYDPIDKEGNPEGRPGLPRDALTNEPGERSSER